MQKTQKKPKSLGIVSRKRQLKTLPDTVPETKTMKLDLTDIPLKVKPGLQPIKKSKSTKTNIESSKKVIPVVQIKLDQQKQPKTGSPNKTESVKPSVGTLKAILKTVEPNKPKKKSKPGLGKSLSAGVDLATNINKKKKKKSILQVMSELKGHIKPLETSIEEVEITKFALGTFNDTAQESAEVGDDGEKKTIDELRKKYPILDNTEITSRFMKVPLNNNQKGRIRQAIKLSLQDTSNKMYPDVINGKIQAILESSPDLTDSDLRRIRILYNMLKTAIDAPAELEVDKTSLKKKKSKRKKNKSKEEDGDGHDSKEKQPANKVKGPKRYVVFLGNLPLNIDKQQIMDHFRELNEHIKDIRLPKLADGTRSAIAFMELGNEPSYELALSKHHSMLGTKRIKVLYTTQKNSKVSKSEAKSKSAKIIALQKAGKLLGSTPISKKRSHRRAIMKKAKAKEATETS